MTPLLTVLVPGADAARGSRDLRTRSLAASVLRGATAVRSLTRRLSVVLADRGAPPRGPDERHWAVGTTLGHLVQDVP